MVFVPGVSTMLKSFRKGAFAIALREAVGEMHRALFLAVLEDVHFVGGGEDVDLAEIAAEDGIEERRFAGLHLADDHEEKRLAQALLQVLQRLAASRAGACRSCARLASVASEVVSSPRLCR